MINLSNLCEELLRERAAVEMEIGSTTIDRDRQRALALDFFLQCLAFLNIARRTLMTFLC